MMGAHVLEQARLHETPQARRRRHDLRLPEVSRRCRSARTTSGTATRRRRTRPTGSPRRRCSSALRRTAQQYGTNAIFLLPVEPLRAARQLRPRDLPRDPGADPEDGRGAGARRGSITLWGDGSPTREFLYVDDCVEGLAARGRALRRRRARQPRHRRGDLDPGSRRARRRARRATGEIGWDTSMPNGQPRRKLDTSRAEELLRVPRRRAAARRDARTVDWYRRACPPEQPAADAAAGRCPRPQPDPTDGASRRRPARGHPRRRGGDAIRARTARADVRRGGLHGGARRYPARPGDRLPGVPRAAAGLLLPARVDRGHDRVVAARPAHRHAARRARRARRGLRDRAPLRRCRGRARRRGAARGRASVPRQRGTRRGRSAVPRARAGRARSRRVVVRARPRAQERPWLAAAAGVALACSILVKLFTGTIFVPLVALAIRNRTSWRTLVATVAGGLGTLAVLAITHVRTVDDFWRGSVSGQLANRDLVAPSHWDNFVRVYHFFDLRTPGAYLAAAGIAIAIVRAVRGSGPRVVADLGVDGERRRVHGLDAAAPRPPPRPARGGDRRAGRDRARCRDRRDPGTEPPPRGRRRGRARRRRGNGAAVAPARPQREAERPRRPLGRRRPPHERAPGRATSSPTFPTPRCSPTGASPAPRSTPPGAVSSRASSRPTTSLRIADDYDVNVVVTGRMLLRSPGLAGKLRARFPVQRTFPGGGAVAYLR